MIATAGYSTQFRTRRCEKAHEATVAIGDACRRKKRSERYQYKLSGYQRPDRKGKAGAANGRRVPKDKQPKWDKKNCVLHFNGTTCTVAKNASNIRRVLDLFEQSGCRPDQIISPFDADPTKHANAIRRPLNEKEMVFTFSSKHNGTAIRREKREPTDEPTDLTDERS